MRRIRECHTVLDINSMNVTNYCRSRSEDTPIFTELRFHTTDIMTLNFKIIGRKNIYPNAICSEIGKIQIA